MAFTCFLSMVSRITSVVCMMVVSVEFHFLLPHCLGVKRRFARLSRKLACHERLSHKSLKERAEMK